VVADHFVRTLGLLTIVMVIAAVSAPAPVTAQERTEVFRIESEAGTPVAELAIFRPADGAMFRASDLASLGATIEAGDDGAVITWGDHVIEVSSGTPVARVDGIAVQLVVPPVRVRGEFYIPVQLLTDVLPDRAPDLLLSDGSSWRAILADADVPGGAVGAPGAATDPGDRTVGDRAVGDRPVAVEITGPRVVIIDPGHGGDDPGAVGPSGVREKDVALGVARHLADILDGDPDFEVHLTRSDDRLVPLWERGPRATELKGERPGLFVSLHTNAVGDRGVRGFETYFLSDGRMTEHERRVVALENAAMGFGERSGTDLSTDPELGSILSDLRNFDHQRWSADLAEEVQVQLERVHPANNRGVKQGPLAVITNSIMPSVLVELGFISNASEEELLASDDFQRVSAEALAGAIRSFFERYPPGAGSR